MVTPSSSASSALTVAASLGPFFDVAAAPEPGWPSWAQLCANPAVLGRRLAEVRGALAAGPGAPVVSFPVVASITQLGLVARLVAPLLGAALVTGTLPVAPATRVQLRLSGSNPLPLVISPTSAVDARVPAELADSFHRHWLTPVVMPLMTAVRAAAPISPRVLTGNTISAVAGALRMAAASRPKLAATADGALDEFLRTGPLAGTGRRRDDGSFARRSCCLFYRLPGAGTCGDCVLHAVSSERPRKR